jgi:hypothetical protein
VELGTLAVEWADLTISQGLLVEVDHATPGRLTLPAHRSASSTAPPAGRSPAVRTSLHPPPTSMARRCAPSSLSGGMVETERTAVRA